MSVVITEQCAACGWKPNVSPSDKRRYETSIRIHLEHLCPKREQGTA